VLRKSTCAFKGSSQETRARYAAKAVQWLADNHDKLADNLDEVDVPEPSGASDTTLAAEEEHILRCLGAALIMQ
jgi:hypothetical protein